MARKYSEELEKDIVDKFKQGISSKEISNFHSIDIKSIYYILSKNNIKPDKRRKISEEIINEIKKRYKNGEKVSDLAKEYGFNYQLIFDYFKRDGLEPCQRKVLSKKEEEMVINDYKEGMWVSDIAKKFQVKHNTIIYDCLHRNNVLLRMDGIRFTEQDICDIVYKYINGYSTPYLAKEYKTNSGVICNFLRKKNVNSRSRYKYICDHNFFDVIDSEIVAYWLGFFVGDGHISIHNDLMFGLSSVDDEHLKMFVSHINSNHKLFYRMANNKSQVWLCIRSKNICEKLRKMGYDNRKSHTAKPPPKDVLSNELERHFWRGMIDSDGCLSVLSVKNRPSPNFTIGLCGTESICEGFYDYIKKNNLININSKTKIKKYNGIFHIRFSHYMGRKIADHLYTEADVYLERKYRKYKYMREIFPIEKDYL